MSRDSIYETRDCGGDAAAYVLGALDRSEAEDFRRHLNSCVVCRDEVAALGYAVDALAVAVPEQPVPTGLRRRVMRGTGRHPTQAERPPRRRWPAVLSGSFVPRPALAGGVLAAVMLAIVGAFELSPGGSDGTRLIRAAVTRVPGNARVVVTRGRAELIVTHLPPPPAGRIYELWIKRGRQAPTPTDALFSVTASGAAEVGVPGNVRGVGTIMVTQEPSGGSLVPTHAPLIVAHLT